jgi:hypothetical protein
MQQGDHWDWKKWTGLGVRSWARISPNRNKKMLLYQGSRVNAARPTLGLEKVD